MSASWRVASGRGARGGPRPPGDAGMAELAVALRDVSVPAYRVVRTEPGALERSVIGFLVDRRGEIERQAASLEGRLAQLALLGRGLDVLAAAIGAFLRRAVALEGRRGDAIVVHAPINVPDAAAAVAAYVARPGSAALRVPLPAPSGDAAPAGRLALLGDRPVTDLERIVAERIAPLLALELARDAQVRQARADARRGDPPPLPGAP